MSSGDNNEVTVGNLRCDLRQAHHDVEQLLVEVKELYLSENWNLESFVRIKDGFLASLVNATELSIRLLDLLWQGRENTRCLFSCISGIAVYDF